MAGTCELLAPLSATYDSEVQDTVTAKYAYTHDADVTTVEQIIDVVNGATLTATGTRVPRRRQRLPGTSMFARKFSVEQDENVRRRFIFTAEFMKPEQLGPGMAAVADMHPIFHPPQIFIERIDKEVAIDKAYNVEPIAGRPANTYGPVTNSIGVETEFPLMETTSKGVIVIRRNVNSPTVALDLNQAFDLTTNNGNVVVLGKTYSARQLGYLCTESSDELEFDDLPYWQIETRINIEKTTDRTIHSTGFRAYNAGGKLVDITGDKDNLPNTEGNGEPITEPVFISRDGTQVSASVPVEINYYYRVPVNYAGFFV